MGPWAARSRAGAGRGQTSSMRTVCTPSATRTSTTLGGFSAWTTLMSPLRSSRASATCSGRATPRRRRSSWAAQVLVQVAPGQVRRPHRPLVDPALADEHDGAALDRHAEAVPAEREGRERPVHGEQEADRGERRAEGRVAGDRAAGEGAQHDAQDHVEGRGLAHEALLAQAHHDHHGRVHDGGAQGHLRGAEFLAVQAEAQRGPQHAPEIVHRCRPPQVSAAQA